MTIFVDTSVWSLLFRKHGPANTPEVDALQRCLGGGERVATTGIVAQELFYGLVSAKAADAIETTFAALIYLAPTLGEHIAAAKLRRKLRASGIQVSGADALIAHLTMAHNLTLLTTDRDFAHAARHVPLRLWIPPAA